MTTRKYDPMSDIDEMDYESFKKGYVNIERLLLRIREYPDVLNMDDKQAAFKTMTKVCLRKMANTLLFILRECKAWNQSIHEVENVDQEMVFARGVGNNASTPETVGKKRKLNTSEEEFINKIRKTSTPKPGCSKDKTPTPTH